LVDHYAGADDLAAAAPLVHLDGDDRFARLVDRLDDGRLAVVLCEGLLGTGPAEQHPDQHGQGRAPPNPVPHAVILSATSRPHRSGRPIALPPRLATGLPFRSMTQTCTGCSPAPSDI